MFKKVKKRLVGVVCVVACVVGLVGCGEPAKSVESVPPPQAESDSSMFVVIEATLDWKVVYHKDTKVMYAVSDGGYNHGTFALLVNPDGTPMLYEP